VFYGAAKDSCTAIGLTLGTGLGSAYYSNGEVKDANLWCSPFKNGIAEDYLSTRWFTMRYREVTGNTVSGVKELVSLSTDSSVIKIFDEFGTNLGLFLRDMTAKRQADVIVIGGNIAHAFKFFHDSLLEALGARAQSLLKRAALGEEASLIGAASCWQAAENAVEKSTRA
jgi:glucokinase